MNSNTIESLWVNVHRNVPANGQFCIVWIDREWAGDSESSASTAHWSEYEGRFDLPGSKIGGNVTHWMPWPGPPIV